MKELGLDKICFPGSIVVRIVAGPGESAYVGRMYQVTDNCSGEGSTSANYAHCMALPPSRWRHANNGEIAAFQKGIVDSNLIGKTNEYSVW